VNIKILLNEIVAAGDMTVKQRDRLLQELTDEVGQLVLRDNYLQSQALSVTQQLGARMLDRQTRFMRVLEKAGRLDRAIEFLPNEETLAERKAVGAGLTRPELAVLLAYAKIALYDDLLASDLPDDPQLGQDLLGYFPQPLRQRYAPAIAEHRLRREIIATVVTNEIVNRLGITFVLEVGEATGMPPADIARAYITSREIFDMAALWQGIEVLDNKVPAQLQSTMLIECGRALERGTVWLLRNTAAPLDIAQTVTTYGAGIAALVAAKGLVSEGDRAVIDQRIAAYVKDGVPEPLASRAAVLQLLAPSLDIVRIAGATGGALEPIGRTYFAVGERFGLNWLRSAAAAVPVENHWDKQAVAAIIEDFYGHQRELTQRILADAHPAALTNGADPIGEWAGRRAPALQRTEALIGDLRQSGASGLAMLAVANRQLRSLIGA
jgi:glutamate dehydrogenase